jgi:hypothetical protein
MNLNKLHLDCKFNKDILHLSGFLPSLNYLNFSVWFYQYILVLAGSFFQRMWLCYRIHKILCVLYMMVGKS